MKHIEECVDDYGEKILVKMTKLMSVNLVKLLCYIGFRCLRRTCVFVILKSMHILSVPHVESTCNVLNIFVTFFLGNPIFSKFLKIYLDTHLIAPTMTGIKVKV